MNLFSTEFLHRETYIHYVTQEEEPLAAMIDEGVTSFGSNVPGPGKYLEMYEDYMYILNGKQKNRWMSFLDWNRFHTSKQVQILVIYDGDYFCIRKIICLLLLIHNLFLVSEMQVVKVLFQNVLVTQFSDIFILYVKFIILG